MMFLLILILAGMTDPVFAQTTDSSLQPEVVSIPGGEGGIGFDDMVFSEDLHKVLVPAGHTGRLFFIDPSTHEITFIGGFSSNAQFEKGHEVGISSADEGGGCIFAADHGRHELMAVDPKTGAVITTIKLAGDADYIRYVGFNHEVWVTEPHNKQIEVFRLVNGTEHQLFVPTALIPVLHGPESLVVDHRRGNAYTNSGQVAAAIDLENHHIIDTWINGCEKPRGLAIDDQKGFLFESCAEGKAVVFDLNQEHKKISDLTTDPGPDVISYNPKLSHLYFTSSKNATLSVIGVSSQGGLSLLGQAHADIKAHCVVSDDQNNIWVCDPPRGQLLLYKDTY
jgi:hypothetical protein